MAEDDYWREEYARNPPAAEPGHAAALAAKDAEIERLQEYVMGKATIATKDLLGKLQAAEAEVARLKEEWGQERYNNEAKYEEEMMAWRQRAQTAEAALAAAIRAG